MYNNLPKEFREKLEKIYSPKDVLICKKWFSTEKRKTVFRINTLKTKTEEVLKILEDNNLKVLKIDFLENAYILENWLEKDLWDLDIFEKWYIYLQSIASQIPVNIIDIRNNEKILDITAAPWWKTTQIAEKMGNTWEIIANDNNAIRIEKLNFTIKRQWATNVKIIKNDARNIKENNPRYVEYFNKIIADLPCSAEWKFNTSREKSYWYWNQQIVQKNYKLQKNIIKNLSDLLKVWWELIYSTCTISPEENEGMVHMILCNYPELQIQDINLDYKNVRPWITKFEGNFYKKEVIKAVRILPSEESEWFFIAKFKKIK